MSLNSLNGAWHKYPDNGLLVKSVRKTYKRAVKYLLDKELEDYLGLDKGKVVIFYQHRPRKKADIYFEETAARIRTYCAKYQLSITSLTFSRYSVRNYFIVCPHGKFMKQMTAVKAELLNSKWEQLAKSQWAGDF